MTAYIRTSDVPRDTASRSAWRTVMVALLTVALVSVAIGLAFIGLQELNDLLARGFVSVSNPSG